MSKARRKPSRSTTLHVAFCFLCILGVLEVPYIQCAMPTNGDGTEVGITR